MTDQNGETGEILKRLKSIELRLNRLESTLSINDEENRYRLENKIQAVDILSDSEKIFDEDKGLEAKVGRFGLAWLGNIVLLLGIVFLTQYLMNLELRFISVLIGYLAAGLIFIMSVYLKKTNVQLAFMFMLNAQVLLFYVTVRLHFFSNLPILSNKIISIILLLLLVAFQTYRTIHEKSQINGALSVVFTLTTAIIVDSTHFLLPLVTLTAAMAIYYYYRFNWKPLLVLTLIFTYISYFLWLFGNPFLGHQMQILTEQHFGIVYLLCLGACFSAVSLFRKIDISSDDFLIGAIITNGILFTLLLILVTLRFFSTGYVTLFAMITISCLVYSTILKSISDWNFASAFYALYGFMAMSISLYGLVGFPKVYLLLSAQSLLVVSIALWFRNRLIIIMNSLLFLFILIIYLLSAKSIDGVNFSFALVSLISARIINWKRSRLQIKTDLIRNLYMVEGFLMVLFSLFHAVPGQFVTLSWTMAALLYFLLSIFLKNVKYRYMALGTMICSAFYLFIVDLAKIGILYRVLAFLFLAAISIGISMYYSNRLKKPDN
jgi:hypothetical protein